MDQQTSSLSFQTRVGLWVTECFGMRTALDVRERALRFCEEALEVVQSFGLTAADAHRIVDYVFGRPIGETTQEIGGAMVTLAALGYATNIDVFAAGDLEATRIETCIPQILAKQQLKAESGGITSSIADEKVCPKYQMHNHLWNQVQETIKEKEAFDTATFLIEGHIDDPKWRMAMRDLLSDNCSPGPYTASTGDPKFDNEEMAVVTNAELTVIAKCGPVRDATTCFDTIAIAACVNAIRKLVIDNNQETSRYKP